MNVTITGSDLFDEVTIANLGSVGTFLGDMPNKEVHVLPIEKPSQMTFIDDGDGNITASY